MDVKRAVGIVPFLQSANPATLASLIPHALLKRYRKGDNLFWDGDDVRWFYFLVTGAAALYKLSNKHDKKVIFLYGQGSMLNPELIDNKPASVCCEILSNSQILCIEKKQFIYACQQDFSLSQALMDTLARKIRRLYRQIKNTSSNVRVDKRIAAKLWKLSKDYGVSCSSGVMIDFDMTITFLADLIGAKRETVSRQLKLLTENGLIIMGKTRFIIPNRDKLKMYFVTASE